MGTIAAQSLIDRAGILLQDTTNTRWPESELLGWLNDGQREIVSHKWDANPVNESVLLASGTKQTVPSGGIGLIDVTRNMGTDGTTPGRAINIIDIEALNTRKPNWHSEAASATIKHYCFNEQNPTVYYVWPAAPGTTYAEIVYPVTPSNITISDSITINDTYANALLDYVLYRAYLKDADYNGNVQRADFARQVFMKSLGLIDKVEMRYNPNYTTRTDISPSYTRQDG